MAHPGNKELAHRQQFYFWKNYRNNRLKHILPRPFYKPPVVPTTSASSQQSVPSLPPVPATSVTVTAAPAPALSPQQYANPPGSSLSKSDVRSSGINRRKRKKDAELLIKNTQHEVNFKFLSSRFLRVTIGLLLIKSTHIQLFRDLDLLFLFSSVHVGCISVP